MTQSTEQLSVRDVSMRFGAVQALSDVSLSLAKGASLGLVGESGSGKSTLAKVIMHMLRPSGGKVLLDGQEIGSRDLPVHVFRRNVQMVFQDPSSSLNPRMSVRECLAEAVRAHRTCTGAALSDEVERLLASVELRSTYAERFPFELSGGQKQRVAIARALAVRPKILVLDEVTSALDVSAQAVILNLLRHLKDEMSLSYIFISHNMDIVRYMCDAIHVMYLGRIVEKADTASFFANPHHPYSQSLLDAVPKIGEPLRDFGSPAEASARAVVKSGCRFRHRCRQGPAYRTDRDACLEAEPPLATVEENASAACHFPLASQAASMVDGDLPASRNSA